MIWERFKLTQMAGDPHGLYDWAGNRYVFQTHGEYRVARQRHLIDWLTGRSPLLFI